jgi:hypothetical protein
MREVVAAHLEEMHSALAVAPQTNEVGRSAALLAGLFDLDSPRSAGGGLVRTRPHHSATGFSQVGRSCEECSRGDGSAYVVARVACRPAEHLPHSIGHRLLASVQHLTE